MAVLLLGGPARAGDPELGPGDGSFFRCDRSYGSSREAALSEGSIDFYHGLSYMLGAGAIRLWGNPSDRWTGDNGFDNGFRGSFRYSSTQARERADLASDFTLGLSAGLLPAASIGAAYYRNRDCVETWEMIGDTTERLGLTIFLTEAVKLAAGRERPYVRGCDQLNPPDDARCDTEDRNRSFWSGHASLAAAGAGLSCSFAIERNAWGSSTTARAVPCVVGGALAVTTGLLRVSSDRHWGTDVLAGFVTGALVGYLDPIGPLDWLRYEKRDANGRIQAAGMVMPGMVEGRFGFRMMAVF